MHQVNKILNYSFLQRLYNIICLLAVIFIPRDWCLEPRARLPLSYVRRVYGIAISRVMI